MKSLTNLYPRITAFSNLLEAARRAQRGKRYRADVLAFNGRLEASLFLLQVVHHALCAVIVPPLERGFLRTSYANRTGYGSHRALRRFAKAAAAHRWVLQADIRLYFPSIDHRILRAQLAERLACPSTLRLLDQILANGAEAGPAIDSFPGDSLLTPLECCRGLPIGNLTSQFLANFRLDRLDHAMAALPGSAATCAMSTTWRCSPITGRIWPPLGGRSRPS